MDPGPRSFQTRAKAKLTPTEVALAKMLNTSTIHQFQDLPCFTSQKKGSWNWTLPLFVKDFRVFPGTSCHPLSLATEGQPSQDSEASMLFVCAQTCHSDSQPHKQQLLAIRSTLRRIACSSNFPPNKLHSHSQGDLRGHDRKSTRARGSRGFQTQTHGPRRGFPRASRC